MAAIFEDAISPAPFTADEDLTAWQYKLVKAASTYGNVERFQHVTIGTGSPVAIGVLLNDPSAGQEATVKCLGFAKVKARASVCDLRLGAPLTGASDGLAEPASGVGDHVIGRWFGPRSTTIDASVLGTVLFMPTTGCGAAFGTGL